MLSNMKFLIFDGVFIRFSTFSSFIRALKAGTGCENVGLADMRGLTTLFCACFARLNKLFFLCVLDFKNSYHKKNLKLKQKLKMKFSTTILPLFLTALAFISTTNARIGGDDTNSTDSFCHGMGMTMYVREVANTSCHMLSKQGGGSVVVYRLLHNGRFIHNDAAISMLSCNYYLFFSSKGESLGIN